MIAATLFNLMQGVRLTLPLRLVEGGLRERPAQLVPLFLVSVGLYLLVDYLVAGEGAQFTPYQISAAGAAAFLLVLLLGLIVAVAGGRGRALGLFVAVLSAAPVFVTVLTWTAGVRDSGLAGWVGHVLWLWGLLILVRCMRHAFSPHLGRPLLAMLAGAALLALTPSFIYVYPTLWYVPADSPEDIQATDVETLYYAQPATLRVHTDALLPERPGEADVYLIAFASDTSQTVFAKEVVYVQKLFDERFDTRGRSLILLNSDDQLEDYPLANGHNLATALKQVSEKMDPHEDYLFLYLTAHGSKDHELSARFWPFRFNDIPAADLRRMLDESGIRRRIIAVSACYSGGFVDALKDDYSVIMTAAAADRTSFGCSNDRDLTYFAQAYFKDTLSSRDSFVAAFAPARELLLERESAAGYEYSDPQIYVGDAIASELDALAETLAGRRHAP